MSALAIPIPVPIPMYGGHHLERGSGAWWIGVIGYGVVCLMAIALLISMLWFGRSMKRDEKRRDEIAEARREAQTPFLALAEQLEGPGWNVSEGFETGIREAATLIRRAAEGVALRESPVPFNRKGYLMELRCPRCLTLTEEELRAEDEYREAASRG